MKVVVDTNVLFSFFKVGSVSRDLILNCPLVLVSPKFACSELRKYSELIMKKSGINKMEFESIFRELKKIVDFIEPLVYRDCVSVVKDICPDRKDVDFFALASFEGSFLWSNDSVLKLQDLVKVYSTREVIDLFFD